MRRSRARQRSALRTARSSLRTAPETVTAEGHDISGPCDEAEHANDPRCSGEGGARVDNSGPGSANSGHGGGHDDDDDDGDREDNSGPGIGAFDGDGGRRQPLGLRRRWRRRLRGCRLERLGPQRLRAGAADSSGQRQRRLGRRLRPSAWPKRSPGPNGRVREAAVRGAATGRPVAAAPPSDRAPQMVGSEPTRDPARRGRDGRSPSPSRRHSSGRASGRGRCHRRRCDRDCRRPSRPGPARHRASRRIGFDVCRELRGQATSRSSCSPRGARRPTGCGPRARRGRLRGQAVLGPGGWPGSAPFSAGGVRRAAAPARWTSATCEIDRTAHGALEATELELSRKEFELLRR